MINDKSVPLESIMAGTAVVYTLPFAHAHAYTYGSGELQYRHQGLKGTLLFQRIKKFLA